MLELKFIRASKMGHWNIQTISVHYRCHCHCSSAHSITFPTPIPLLPAYAIYDCWISVIYQSCIYVYEKSWITVKCPLIYIMCQFIMAWNGKDSHVNCIVSIPDWPSPIPGVMLCGWHTSQIPIILIKWYVTTLVFIGYDRKLNTQSHSNSCLNLPRFQLILCDAYWNAYLYDTLLSALYISWLDEPM